MLTKYIVVMVMMDSRKLDLKKKKKSEKGGRVELCTRGLLLPH